MEKIEMTAINLHGGDKEGVATVIVEVPTTHMTTFVQMVERLKLQYRVITAGNPWKMVIPFAPPSC